MKLYMVNNFPIIASHYVREQSNHNYVSSDLIVAKLYTFYREKRTIYKVGKETIRNIFNEKININFHKPKKNHCEV